MNSPVINSQSLNSCNAVSLLHRQALEYEHRLASPTVEVALRKLVATRAANPYAIFNFCPVAPNYTFLDTPPIVVTRRISVKVNQFVEARRSLQLMENVPAAMLDAYLLKKLECPTERPGCVGQALVVEVLVKSTVSGIVRDTEFRAAEFSGDALGAFFDWTISIFPYTFALID